MGHFEQKPWSITKKQELARKKSETPETMEYDFSGTEGVFGGVDDEDELGEGKLIKH